MSSLVFRLCENAPEIVRDVFLDRGWREYEEEEDDESDWNLWWKNSGFRTSDFEECRPWQRLNHFPKSIAITRKDCLARCLRRMKGVYGNAAYNFVPLSFNLPNDYRKFVSEYSKQKEAGKTVSWICKPTDQSRGKGIFIFRDLSKLTYDCATVVQKYIHNPLLIAGYKFDLRIYVLVTSFRPLHVYVYHEGLVRFGTEKFDLKCLENVYSHLTNTSINKQSPCYATDKERIGSGCKWSIGQLRIYFHQNNVDDRLLWNRINAIIILTLLAQAPEVQENSSSCFELFGFDILIDASLKPWLLEVNFSPSLGIDCDLDIEVKKPLLQDTIDVINLNESDISTQSNCIVNVDICKKRINNARPNSQMMFPLQSQGNLTGKRNRQQKSNFRVSATFMRCNSRKVIDKCKSESNLSISSCDSAQISNVGKMKDCSDDVDSELLYLQTSKVFRNDECIKVTGQCCNEETKTDHEPSGPSEAEECLVTGTTQIVKNSSPLFKNASLEFKEAYCCDDNFLDSSTLSKSDNNPKACNLKNQGKYASTGTLYFKKNNNFAHPESSIDGEDESYFSGSPKRSTSHSSRPTSLPPLKKSIFVKNKYTSIKRPAQITPKLPAKKYELPKKDNTRKLNQKDRNENGFSKMKVCNRVGNYELIFPFNDASQKSCSSKQINSKSAIDEVKKALHKATELIKASTTSSSSLSGKEIPLDLNKPYWGFSSLFNYTVGN